MVQIPTVRKLGCLRPKGPRLADLDKSPPNATTPGQARPESVRPARFFGTMAHRTRDWPRFGPKAPALLAAFARACDFARRRRNLIGIPNLIYRAQNPPRAQAPRWATRTGRAPQEIARRRGNFNGSPLAISAPNLHNHYPAPIRAPRIRDSRKPHTHWDRKEESVGAGWMSQSQFRPGGDGAMNSEDMGAVGVRRKRKTYQRPIQYTRVSRKSRVS